MGSMNNLRPLELLEAVESLCVSLEAARWAPCSDLALRQERESHKSHELRHKQHGYHGIDF